MNDLYIVASAAFRSQIRGDRYYEANDFEAEIWRDCQRSGTRGMLVMSVPAAVYIVGGTLPSTGLG